MFITDTLENGRPNRLLGKTATASGFRIRKYEILRSLTHITSRHAHSITEQLGKGRGAVDDLYSKDEKGPVSSRQTLKLVPQRQHVETSEIRGEAHSLII